MWQKKLMIFVLFLGIAAAVKCPAKMTSGQPKRPTLPDLYSTTYEFSEFNDFTSIVQEEHDGVQNKFSMLDYSSGKETTIYETGGTNRQIFQVSAGKCQQLQPSNLTSHPIFGGLRQTTDLAKDKNIYLKFLVDLPDKYLIGFKGKVTLPELHSMVDDWLFCIDGIMINIYWTTDVKLTHASLSYPIKISVNYPTPGKSNSNLYVFKFLAHQVNQSAIDPPSSVYCKNRYSNNVLNTNSFIGSDMYFKSEIIDTAKKTISPSEHYYVMDENVAVIITPDPNPKHPNLYIAKINYVFDFTLGYYFTVNSKSYSCQANPISSYVEHLGDIFVVQKNMFANPKKLFGNYGKYYNVKKAWQRGILTNMYQGYRAGYPLGEQNTDSVINWYMVPKNENGVSVPVALEFYTFKRNSPSSIPTGKVTYDLYNWEKKANDDIISTDQNMFQVYYCTKRSNEPRMKFTVSIPQSASLHGFNSNTFKRLMKIALSKAAGISILRIGYTYLHSQSPGQQTVTFIVFDQFTNVPMSKKTPQQAVSALVGVINSGSFNVTMKSYDNMPLTITAVPRSLVTANSMASPAANEFLAKHGLL